MTFRSHVAYFLLIGLASTVSAQTNRIMLTGYWPPTNEMVRVFSTSPTQNPGGWQGENWEGSGYDIYSFFPEFNNFPNDRIGTGDFEVDYQDTSEDFWRITEEIRPVAIITFSRTDSVPMQWEVEWRQRNLANWVNDYRAPLQPTPSPPDSSVPAGTVRYSTLPMANIAAAVQESGVRSFVDMTSFGGGFLSEFMAYHGVWYHDLHSDPNDPFRNVAAGHIHVGGNLSASQTRVAVDATLRQVISHVDFVLGVPEPSGMLAVVVLACGWLGVVRRR